MIRILVMLLLASCSVFKASPPIGSPTASPSCSVSRAAPTADIVLAVTTGIVAGSIAVLYTLGASISDSETDTGLTALALGGGALGILGFSVSASSGFRKASACRAAKEEWALMQLPPTPAVPIEAPGSDRGECRVAPDPLCDAGLTCASGRCVVLPPLPPPPPPPPE